MYEQLFISDCPCGAVGVWLWRNCDTQAIRCGVCTRSEAFESIPNVGGPEPKMPPLTTFPMQRCGRGHRLTYMTTGFDENTGKRHCKRCAWITKTAAKRAKKTGQQPRNARSKTHCLRGHEREVYGWHVDSRGWRTCAECVRLQRVRQYAKAGRGDYEARRRRDAS